MSWLSFREAGSPYIYFDIDYSPVRISNTKMRYTFTVKWHLAASDSWLGTGFLLQIKAVCEGIDSGWKTMREYSDYTQGTGVHTLSFSLDVPSTTAGASQTVYFYGRNNSTFESDYMSFTKSANVVTSALLYTNCTSASNVSISSSIILPSQNITVKWNKGGNGTNNPITGYDVYLRCSSNGALPTTSTYLIKQSVSSSATSCTFSELSNLTRGYLIVAGVVTKSQYNTTAISTGGSTRINVLPPPPTMNNSSITILSTNTTGTTITGSVGKKTSSEGYESDSIWYRKNNTSNTLQALSSATLFLEGTWNFYTKDKGGEFSSSCSQVIVKKNIKPKITNFNIASQSETVVYKNSIKQENFCEQISVSWEANKICNYTFTGDKLTLQGEGVSGTNSLLLNLRDYNLTKDTPLTFSLELNDNLEKDSQTNNTQLKLSSPPNYRGYYNQFSNESVSGSTKTNFYNRIRFVYDYDSYYYKNGIFSTSQKDNISSISKGGGEKEKVFWYDVLLKEEIPSGTYTFTNNFSSIINEENLFKVPLIIFSSGSTKIKPFTAKNQDILIPFSKISESSELDKENCYSIRLFLGGENILLNEINPNGWQWLETGSDYSYLKTTIIDKTFWELLSEIITFPISGERTGYFEVRIKNRFGKETVSSTQNYPVILDFTEDFSISTPEITSGLVGSSSVSINDIKNTGISENLILKFTPTVKTYNSDSISYSLQIKRGEKDFEDYLTGTATTAIGNKPGYETPITFSLDLSKKVGELTDNKNCKFRLKVSADGREVISSSTLEYKRIPHSPTKISFIEGSYLEETNPIYSFTYSLEKNISETHTSEKVVAIIGNNEHNLSYTKWDVGIASFSTSTKMGTNYQEIRLKTITTKTISYGSNTLTTTKESLSNSLLIYSLVPTLSYRQNHLGVNYIPEKDNSILEVSPYSQRDKIYFYSPSRSIPVYFNLTEGKIYNLLMDIDCGEIT